MRTHFRFSAVVVAVSAFGVASAQFGQRQEQGLGLGPSVGLFIPTGSEMRNAFDSQLLTYGFGPSSADRPKERRFVSDFNVVSARRNGNKLFLFQVLQTYEIQFGDRERRIVPYARGGAGLAYYDYSITKRNGSRVSTKAGGWSATAEAGIVFNRQIALSARYNLFQRRDGISFDGWSLSATYTLLRI